MAASSPAAAGCATMRSSSEARPRTDGRQAPAIGDEEIVDVVSDAHVVYAADQLLQLRQDHGISGRAARRRPPVGSTPRRLQQRVAAAAAGLEPDLVEAQDVLVGMGMGRLGELVERIDHGLEFLRQLREDVAEHPALAPGQRFGEHGVGAPAHGDVIVDVDQLAREALREEAGDEERDVSQALQAAVAVAGAARLERLRQHDHQRFQARALGSPLEQRLGAGEQSQQVDDVVLGLVLDREPLALQRAVQSVPEVFLQVGNRLHPAG